MVDLQPKNWCIGLRSVQNTIVETNVLRMQIKFVVYTMESEYFITELRHMSTSDLRYNCRNQVIKIKNMALRIKIANQEW